MSHLAFNHCKKKGFLSLQNFCFFRKAPGPIEAAICHNDADVAHADYSLAAT